MVHGAGRLRSLLLGAFCLAAGIARSQAGGDLEARILYAYQTEDPNELRSLIQSLETQLLTDGANAALRYHVAHAHYRVGLLSEDARPHDAETSFAACVLDLQSLLRRDAASVESLALQSACYSNLARFRPMESVLVRSRAAERMVAADKLAPRNPRVAFLHALDVLARAKAGSPEHRQACADLSTAARLFEETSATAVDEPAWGHAEAYLEWGRQLEARGDVVEARDWIEKSLIMAPDFKAAQRQLATLVQR